MKPILLAIFVGTLGSSGCYLVTNGDAQSTEADGDTDVDTGANTREIADKEPDTNAPENDTDTVPPECRGPIDFPDAFLMKKVRLAIGKPSGDIYYDDVDDLVEFTTATRDCVLISDLTGLQCLSNLTSLTLCYVKSAKGIGPLAELTHLTSLVMFYGELSDLSPLAGLTHLTDLDLDQNGISDISPLAGLTQLTYLNLGYNGISDISPLAGLTQLTYLNLAYNGISDISPLAGLTHLTELYLWGNSISDLSALVSNSGVDSGDNVDVEKNPLDCDDAATQVDIATLEERGVTLAHDCPI